MRVSRELAGFGRVAILAFDGGGRGHGRVLLHQCAVVDRATDRMCPPGCFAVLVIPQRDNMNCVPVTKLSRDNAAHNRSLLFAFSLLFLAMTVMARAFAADPVAVSGSAAAGTVITVAPPKASVRRLNPVIEPASAIAAESQLDWLRKGGFVLYLRHTETGAITEQCNVSNLSPKGAAAARELGLQLKQLGIPVGRVLTSPVCRVQETARLVDAAEVELSDDLAQVPTSPGIDLYAARMRQLATMPRTGTNTLVVSHMHGGGKPHQAMDLEFGEIIVFHPDGKGGSKPVARIRAESWPGLASAKSVSK